MYLEVFVFLEQKTADELRISDWSSDVCSSDLRASASRAACSQAVSSSAPAGVAASKGAASLTSTAGVVARPEREHVHAGPGHGDHVFPLRRQPAVLGNHGPAVGQHLGVALALDRKSTRLNSSH